MKLVVASIAVAVFSLLAWVAVLQSRADLLAYQGRTILRASDQDRASFPREDWDVAQTQLEHAIGLQASNAGMAEDLGRLHELRSRAFWKNEPRTDLDSSLRYLRRSLNARPTSPYTWANLALVKSRLGELDEELFRSVHNAAELGPWEPEVQLVLADIGFRYWNRMPAEVRSAIQAAMQRALKRQDGKLFDLAATYGRLDVLCATPGIFRSRKAIRCI